MSPEPAAGERAVPTARPIGVLYGFRALMALLICNYHIWQLGWLPQRFTVLGIPLDLDSITRSGYLFVDGMLLLSGFLLYLPYARRSAMGTPIPSLPRYYGNRLIRILPSYLLSVLALLFLAALPRGAYRDGAAAAKDIVTHLTFTFTFWTETYLHTPLNGALWTVAVEMQYYLIFPFLAKAAQKKPVWTLSAMGATGLGFRALLYYGAGAGSAGLPSLAILVNQMPAFLDVYALGMLGAILYVRACDPSKNRPETRRRGRAWAALAVFAAGCAAACAVLRIQTHNSREGIEALRLSQLRVRFPFALSLLSAMLGAALMPRFLQKLLDNRLMRFLAAISFNLYIWHQPLAALIAGDWFPDTLHGSLPMQQAYTAACFSIAILAAMAVTFGVEQPVTRLYWRIIEKHGRKTDDEGPQTAKAGKTTDPILLRTESRSAGAD
ncbi:MAG: acyltransferase family protein [Clostridia bacterium]|nr:acyltransferase family protein [Clostridia bacterium]